MNLLYDTYHNVMEPYVVICICCSSSARMSFRQNVQHSYLPVKSFLLPCFEQANFISFFFSHKQTLKKGYVGQVSLSNKCHRWHPIQVTKRLRTNKDNRHATRKLYCDLELIPDDKNTKYYKLKTQAYSLVRHLIFVWMTIV